MYVRSVECVRFVAYVLLWSVCDRIEKCARSMEYV